MNKERRKRLDEAHSLLIQAYDIIEEVQDEEQDAPDVGQNQIRCPGGKVLLSGVSGPGKHGAQGVEVVEGLNDKELHQEHDAPEGHHDHRQGGLELPLLADGADQGGQQGKGHRQHQERQKTAHGEVVLRPDVEEKAVKQQTDQHQHPGRQGTCPATPGLTRPGALPLGLPFFCPAPLCSRGGWVLTRLLPPVRRLQIFVQIPFHGIPPVQKLPIRGKPGLNGKAALRRLSLSPRCERPWAPGLRSG